MTSSPDALRFKVVVVGDSGVGKTSMVFRLTTGNFKPGADPTIGVTNFKFIAQTDEGPVELAIWDTAGQEIFNSLVPLYSRSAASCILVCSTDVESSISRIEWWLKVLEESCDPLPPVILALNKIDLMDEADTTLEKLKLEYPKVFTNIFAVSALTGENIEGLFLASAMQACKFSGVSIKSVYEAANAGEKEYSCC